MEPATSIIRQLGGAAKVARIVGIHPTRIYGWMRTREDGGTGGRIPSAHFVAVLRAAREAGIDEITPDLLLSADVAEAAQ